MSLPERTICALVAYDGTDFRGFQFQANAPSVQDVLERALDRVCERKGRVSGAGRTDAGVHADGQVIAVQVAWRHDLADLERAWNVHLPASVSVRYVREAPDRFHPRFSAISRTYRYVVQCYRPQAGFPAPRTSPLTRRFVHFEVSSLDVAAMNQAAECLVGVHDFTTFGWPSRGESTVRRLLVATWRESACSLPELVAFPGRQLVFTITANAFLRQMVRKIVGTLLAVGKGFLPPEAMEAALVARDRSLSAPPAAPQGLVLERVTYPDDLDRWVHGNMLD